MSYLTETYVRLDVNRLCALTLQIEVMRDRLLTMNRRLNDEHVRRPISDPVWDLHDKTMKDCIRLLEHSADLIPSGKRKFKR